VNPLAQSALAYADRGWVVFPCEKDDKRPLGRLVRNGFKDASTDREQIERWWSAEPDANIGLPTGQHFDVLDVDGDTGWHTLAHLTAEYGCLSSSPVALTPRGGAHYLFQPTGCGNRAGFRPSLDWRGSGGYVVATPSLVGGRGYTWGVAPDEQPIQPAPQWLVQLLTKPAAPPPPAAPVRGDLSAYARAALERELGRLVLAPVGTRNDQLNRSAHAIGQLVGARMLTTEEAGEALLGAAVRIGLGEDEAYTTIRSGMKAGILSPRKVAS